MGFPTARASWDYRGMPAAPPEPKVCLQCGYQRRPSDPGRLDCCPSCNGNYAKVEASMRAREELAAVVPPPPVREQTGTMPALLILQHDVPAYVDADRRRTTHLVYVLYVLPIGVTAYMAYAIAKSLKEDYQDEIAAAHNEWQYETLRKILWPFFAAVGFAAILGLAQGGYLLTHDNLLHHFAQRLSTGLLVVGGALYLWTLVRTLRGWPRLWQGKGP